MAFRLQPPFCRYPFTAPTRSTKPIRIPKFHIRNLSFDDNDSRKLVMEVKEKLEKDHFSLPVGRNGRDDEGMILWFLKDRKFSVEEAVSKLTKAIKWHQEFGVAELSEDSLKSIAATGKAYIHDHLDVSGRPVLIVDASKHLPGMQDPSEDERLCVFLVEKALSKLPDGKEEILGIFDLRSFGTKNADLRFLTFLVSVTPCWYGDWNQGPQGLCLSALAISPTSWGQQNATTWMLLPLRVMVKIRYTQTGFFNSYLKDGFLSEGISCGFQIISILLKIGGVVIWNRGGLFLIYLT